MGEHAPRAPLARSYVSKQAPSSVRPQSQVPSAASGKHTMCLDVLNLTNNDCVMYINYHIFMKNQYIFNPLNHLRLAT